jgi:hypothetical protein
MLLLLPIVDQFHHRRLCFRKPDSLTAGHLPPLLYQQPTFPIFILRGCEYPLKSVYNSLASLFLLPYPTKIRSTSQISILHPSQSTSGKGALSNQRIHQINQTTYRASRIKPCDNPQAIHIFYLSIYTFFSLQRPSLSLCLQMVTMAKPYLTSQYAATYRVPASRDHHGFFASPTESEFSEHFDKMSSPTSLSSSVKSWDEGRVADWLRTINCGQYTDIFTTNNINGLVLMELDRKTLKELGVKRVGDQIRIATEAKAFRYTEYKIKAKSKQNRDSLALLYHPQFTPPSSASPKSTHPQQRFGNRDQSKRVSTVTLQYPQSATQKYVLDIDLAQLFQN